MHGENLKLYALTFWSILFRIIFYLQLL